MVLYKAVESLELDDAELSGEVSSFNKHAVLEDSIKLYRKLQRTKKSHRSVMDNQLYDIRTIENEHPISLNKDSKEHLIRCLVGKMIRN